MVLESKLGIGSYDELKDAEERLTKARAAQLFSNGILDELDPGTFKALSSIHRYLFQDIYDFAGVLRDKDISEGGFRFASAL